MANLTAPDRFRKLVDVISRLYLKTRAAQVQFAWEAGQHIIEEEQNGAMRAKYGTRLIPELSKALSEKHGPGFSERTLQNMRHFYKLYPIAPVTAELNWTDYVELLPLKDKKARRQLEQRVRKEGLTSVQLRKLVRNIRAASKDKPTADLPALKRPADLTLNTFAQSPLNIKVNAGEVLIDCGFFVNWPAKKDELKGLKITEQPSYTYVATIERVVDGDTLLALIEVGFRIIVKDKLRLRGIDTPEISDPEGINAKKFVEKLLPAGSVVVIKSHKSRKDIYGRFVADIFYSLGAKGALQVLAKPVYLNQQLLDEGLAVRMAE